jgi:hypothetical protein
MTPEEHIAGLERSNRRWKRLALTGWAGLALALLLGVGLAAWVVQEQNRRLEDSVRKAEKALREADGPRPGVNP